MINWLWNSHWEMIIPLQSLFSVMCVSCNLISIISVYRIWVYELYTVVCIVLYLQYQHYWTTSRYYRWRFSLINIWYRPGILFMGAVFVIFQIMCFWLFEFDSSENHNLPKYLAQKILFTCGGFYAHIDDNIKLSKGRFEWELLMNTQTRSQSDSAAYTNNIQGSCA